MGKKKGKKILERKMSAAVEGGRAWCSVGAKAGIPGSYTSREFNIGLEVGVGALSPEEALKQVVGSVAQAVYRDHSEILGLLDEIIEQECKELEEKRNG